MNTLKCYEVKNLTLTTYKKVSSTNEYMTFIDSAGDQIKRKKNNFNASNVKYYDHKYYALKHLRRKHKENVDSAYLIGSNEYRIALRMAEEFERTHPDIESLKEY